MLIRVRMAKSGLVEYLITGKRFNSDLTRKEKDNVVPLFGNIENLRSAEDYTNKYKQWKNNYEHITISLSKKDMKKLEQLSDDEYNKALQDITMLYIKHRTSGYDLDNEVIAYAELHEPKIKYNEKGKERLSHIHIGISYLNPLSDTKLRTTFYNNSFISETIATYIAKKYDLEKPKYDENESENEDGRRERLKENGIDVDTTKWGILRRQFIDDCKLIRTESELINYLNNCGHKWEKRKDKFTIIPDGMRTINLRGFKDFPTVENILNKVENTKDFIKEIRNKDVKELEKILAKYYGDRIEMIDKRRSKKTKEKLEKIYSEEVSTNENSFTNLSYQQKLFLKHYDYLIKDDLKGYFIEKIEHKIIIENKKKDILLEDSGEKIKSISNSTNLEEEINLMIDISLAKGWKLEEIKINGDEDFVNKSNELIVQRLEKQKANDLILQEQEKEIILKSLKSPKSEVQNLKKELENKALNKTIDENFSLSLLKENLRADAVLKFAKEKFLLIDENYEITADNKINNKTNKQKPKNVIEFFKKEINLSSAESIEICTLLYKNQPIKFEKENNTKEELVNMPMKISISKDSNINALGKWEQVEVSNYKDLTNLMIKYPYSSTIFEKGYRNSDNAQSFNNVLIFDIDNDKYTPTLSINEARKILESHGISAMILPSKSHNKEKKVSSKVQKQAGIKPFEEYHIAERYRIVIPTNRALNTNDLEIYREYQELISKSLKLEKYVDKAALNDKSRFYYPSPTNAESIVIKANAVLKIDAFETQAHKNISFKKEQQKEEVRKIENIEKNLTKYTHTSTNNENLTFADTNKIMNLKIDDLIKYYEKENESYLEGKYQMIKTSSSKYSIISENVAHDFKNDITYNSLTYLQKQMNTRNINTIAKELEKITGEKYIKVNYDLAKNTILEAIKTASNDRELEDKIKTKLNVKYCKLEEEYITIADVKIPLKDIDLEKRNIASQIIKNRKNHSLKTH